MGVEEIGVGKGHSFADEQNSRRFRLELSEGSSRFVDLKEEVIFNILMADGAEYQHTIGDCMRL